MLQDEAFVAHEVDIWLSGTLQTVEAADKGDVIALKYARRRHDRLHRTNVEQIHGDGHASFAFAATTLAALRPYGLGDSSGMRCCHSTRCASDR
jgi:hypothetical protein